MRPNLIVAFAALILALIETTRIADEIQRRVCGWLDPMVERASKAVEGSGAFFGLTLLFVWIGGMPWLVATFLSRIWPEFLQTYTYGIYIYIVLVGGFFFILVLGMLLWAFVIWLAYKITGKLVSPRNGVVGSISVMVALVAVGLELLH